MDSTEDSTTSVTYEDGVVTLNFAEGLKGTKRQIDIKGKYTTNSPGFIRIVNAITSELFF